MVAISQGLKEGVFFRSLVKKLLGGHDELLDRTEKYINVKKAQKARQTQRGASPALAGKNSSIRLVPPKSDHFKSFPMEASRSIAQGVMVTEYLSRPRTAREKDMDICERHRVLRRIMVMWGHPRTPPPHLLTSVDIIWSMSIPVKDVTG